MANLNLSYKNTKHEYDKLTSNERAIEWYKARSNPFYFIFNYAYMEEIGGKLKYAPELMNFKMRRMIKAMHKFHFAILMASRQLGKSTVAGVLLEWANNFYPGNKSMIFNMTKDTSLENLIKIKFCHNELPSWMKIALRYKGDRKTYIEYEHGSVIKTFYPSSAHDPATLGRSLTYPCMYIDEAAFIRHLGESYSSAQPALIKAQEQAERNGYPFFTLITATPNGTVGTGEYFHSLWCNAVDSDEIFPEGSDKFEVGYEDIVNDETKNGYVRVKYHWSEDPVKDDAWYIKQKRRLNFDRRKINQELDLLFVGGSNCIFEDEFLESLVPKKPIMKYDIGLNAHLKFFVEPDPKDYFLLGIDTAKSMVGDFCAIEIYSFSNFEQIGEYYGRVGKLIVFKDMIKSAVHYLHNIVGDRIILCIENNFESSIIEQLQEDLICAPLIWTPVDAPVHANLKFKGSPRSKRDGINTNAQTKPQMIAYFNDYISDNPHLIHSSNLIDELNVIERKINGGVAAQSGHHDDLFMSSCFCAYVRRQTEIDILPLIGKTSKEGSNAYIENIVSTIKEYKPPGEMINGVLYHDDLDFNKTEENIDDYLTIM